MHNNEQMIKPEKDSKVEKPHLLLPLNRKRKKNCNPKLLIYPPHLRTAATLSWGNSLQARQIIRSSYCSVELRFILMDLWLPSIILYDLNSAGYRLLGVMQNQTPIRDVK